MGNETKSSRVNCKQQYATPKSYGAPTSIALLQCRSELKLKQREIVLRFVDRRLGRLKKGRCLCRGWDFRFLRAGLS